MSSGVRQENIGASLRNGISSMPDSRFASANLLNEVSSKFDFENTICKLKIHFKKEIINLF